ncbi:disease resistance protein At4g27190-like [Fagus crenata]
MRANVWLIKVVEIEREVRPMLEASLNKSTCSQDCCLDCNMCNRYQLSKSVAQKAVTIMPAPSLVDQKAAEERQSSVLHIRLDTVGCLALDSTWLGRLKKFSIEISPRSCSSNYLPNQHDAKVVILRGVDLMEIGLEGLLRNACALDLVTCGGMREVSEIAGRRSLCGLPGLKSLTITSCEWITELVNGENVQGSMLPNLEHLRFIRLRNLLKIVEGGILEGGCLGKLKTIEVVDCRRLKTVISYALLCQVQNLEEIKAWRNCDMWLASKFQSSRHNFHGFHGKVSLQKSMVKIDSA